MKSFAKLAGILLSMGMTTATMASVADIGRPAIIPEPQKIEMHAGSFTLNPETRVYVDSASGGTAAFLTKPLRRSTGFPFAIDEASIPGASITNGILLTTANAKTNLGPEGYELIATPDSVVIRAPSQAGLFYGVQTLLQLLPPEIYCSNRVVNADWQAPCVQIEDWPQFKWRGLMLDVCRHFYTKAQVETVLDAMALHKLNVFHWHLTDDQAWRIQIKKYPKLTSVGAWRDGVGFGLASNSTTAYGPDGRYGGFYTQDDIRDVVAYAAARHITIVPEIEMPGHATAALAAYPQLSCTGGPFVIPQKGGIFNGIYDPAKKETFTFLENVLTEVFQLFPSKYVHIGGDEVPKDTWKNSADCQALMKREGLKNEEELQGWFIRRIEKFVSAHGKTMIGWSEILQGGLAKNAAVMDWIGGAEKAASTGHDVVMSPTGYCYLDQYQSQDRSAEPHAIGGFISLQKTYSFEPVSPKLPKQYAAHVLGGQGNLWTEYIPNLNYAEYMIFPRECAIAEATWSPESARNWEGFEHRLQIHEKRLDELGINYRHNSKDLGKSASTR